MIKLGPPNAAGCSLCAVLKMKKAQSWLTGSYMLYHTNTQKHMYTFYISVSMPLTWAMCLSMNLRILAVCSCFENQESTEHRLTGSYRCIIFQAVGFEQLAAEFGWGKRQDIAFKRFSSSLVFSNFKQVCLKSFRADPTTLRLAGTSINISEFVNF